MSETMEWLSSGLLAGRKVTKCQRRTKAYASVQYDVHVQASTVVGCPPPSFEVYKGTDASGTVHAVVLFGRSVRSSGPAMVAARMAAKCHYRLLMFRYSPDSGRWTAVFTKEG